MTTNRTIHSTLISISVVFTIAGCSKSSAKGEGIPCDAKAIAAFAASLDKANGMNVDLTDEHVKADIATAKAAITGKHVAFTGCTFRSQGNDEVSFADAAGGKVSIDCTMKGGEKGVDAFRTSAMRIGQEKLRLDVSGEVAMGGMKGFERLGLRSCEISTHE